MNRTDDECYTETGPAAEVVPEGCTPADAKLLRAANYQFAEENQRLREALRYYASKAHFMLSEPEAWDTVSGEPANFWCDEAGTATVEDGSVAAFALRGEPLPGEPSPVCHGEPESFTELLAQRDELAKALECVLRDYLVVHGIGDWEMQPSFLQARGVLSRIKGA